MGDSIPSAHLRSRATPACVLLLLGVGLVWLGRHAANSYAVLEHREGRSFEFLWFFVFVSLAWHLALAWLEKPYSASPDQEKQLDGLRVVLNVPCYNEDPRVLAIVLESVLLQRRPFHRVQVVNDGSDRDLEALAQVEAWWLTQQERTSTILEWVNVPNGGKRHAQLVTFLDDDEADVFATMDSDTVLDRSCVAEGLKPFVDPRVSSVTSVILAYNNRDWFVRLTDPWLLAFQLVVRGAMSKLGCVLVNSGNFSLYRADVIRDAAAVYADERFLGRPVQFSDDSLLTLFAHLQGRTVQQLSSFAFTVLPNNVHHHLRQQLRWMRGSTIRSIWRFRYLSFRSYAYWEHFASWVNFVLITCAFTFIVVLAPVTHAALTPAMLGFTLIVCYMTALRYLTIARSDQSAGWQIRTLLLAPAMLVWTAFVLRPLRLYAIATCRRTGWGTRSGKIEVTLPQGRQHPSRVSSSGSVGLIAQPAAGGRPRGIAPQD